MVMHADTQPEYFWYEFLQLLWLINTTRVRENVKYTPKSLVFSQTQAKVSRGDELYIRSWNLMKLASRIGQYPQLFVYQRVK